MLPNSPSLHQRPKTNKVCTPSPTCPTQAPRRSGINSPSEANSRQILTSKLNRPKRTVLNMPVRRPHAKLSRMNRDIIHAAPSAPKTRPNTYPLDPKCAPTVCHLALSPKSPHITLSSPGLKILGPLLYRGSGRSGTVDALGKLCLNSPLGSSISYEGMLVGQIPVVPTKCPEQFRI